MEPPLLILAGLGFAGGVTFALVVRRTWRAPLRCAAPGSDSDLPCPPARGADVDALAHAAERLEASVLAAGWTALPRGEAYAKRFAWEPAGIDNVPPSAQGSSGCPGAPTGARATAPSGTR
jgi:hypothetical protein